MRHLRVERCREVEAQGWLELRKALWPETARERHRFAMQAQIDDPERHVAFVAYAADGAALGFAEASLRFDHVNGTTSSPVAFLEGLFVRDLDRRRGVARELLDAVLAWAALRGCRELASDVELANTVGQRVHRALGFEETERVVYFKRRVPRLEQP